eukprot:RCo046729
MLVRVVVPSQGAPRAVALAHALVPRDSVEQEGEHAWCVRAAHGAHRGVNFGSLGRGRLGAWHAVAPQQVSGEGSGGGTPGLPIVVVGSALLVDHAVVDEGEHAWRSLMGGAQSADAELPQRGGRRRGDYVAASPTVTIVAQEHRIGRAPRNPVIVHIGAVVVDHPIVLEREHARRARGGGTPAQHTELRRGSGVGGHGGHVLAGDAVPPQLVIALLRAGGAPQDPIVLLRGARVERPPKRPEREGAWRPHRGRANAVRAELRPRGQGLRGGAILAPGAVAPLPLVQPQVHGGRSAKPLRLLGIVGFLHALVEQLTTVREREQAVGTRRGGSPGGAELGRWHCRALGAGLAVPPEVVLVHVVRGGTPWHAEVVRVGALGIALVAVHEREHAGRHRGCRAVAAGALRDWPR